MDLGRPIVVVAINYRLNCFGFLSSRELIEEAHAEGETPVLNQGLNDQSLALRWIQHHISHFGGDSGQVTLSGESAGAISVIYHLKPNSPFFHQPSIHSNPPP